MISLTRDVESLGPLERREFDLIRQKQGENIYSYAPAKWFEKARSRENTIDYGDEFRSLEALRKSIVDGLSGTISFTLDLGSAGAVVKVN